MKNVIKAAIAVVFTAGTAGAAERPQLNSELPGVYAQAKALHKSAFKVGAVSITVKPVDFILHGVKAQLKCHFEDGSGAVQRFPEQELNTSIKQLGETYRVDIAAGELSKFSLFADLKSCRYVLQVFDQVSNILGMHPSYDIILAGSGFNMTEAELTELFNDRTLNEKISAKYQPLKLSRRGGYMHIVK